jgi:hypothetical protein
VRTVKILLVVLAVPAVALAVRYAPIEPTPAAADPWEKAADAATLARSVAKDHLAERVAAGELSRADAVREWLLLDTAAPVVPAFRYDDLPGDTLEERVAYSLASRTPPGTPCPTPAFARR